MKLFIGFLLLLSFNTLADDSYQRAEITKESETQYKIKFKDKECTVQKKYEFDDNTIEDFIFDVIDQRFDDQHDAIGTVGEFHLSKATKMSLDREGVCK